MWIIVIGFIVFIGILCAVDWREQDKKDAEKAVVEAGKQARREQIASSPNVEIIAQAIVSRWGFPQRIEINRESVSIWVRKPEVGEELEVLYYKSLGIADIYDDDRYTLMEVLADHPLLEHKYTKHWRNGSNDYFEDYWLELKKPTLSTNLQKW